MELWSDKWLLKFHPEKCKHIRLAKHKPDVVPRYQLLGQEIDLVEEEKDIGVIVDSELSFESHIYGKIKKANSTFAAIRRAFQNLDATTFLPIYKSMVRTHLDYASSVWSPMKKKLVEDIEKVQKRATKQVTGMKNLSYPERTKKTGTSNTCST